MRGLSLMNRIEDLGRPWVGLDSWTNGIAKKSPGNVTTTKFLGICLKVGEKDRKEGKIIMICKGP